MDLFIDTHTHTVASGHGSTDTITDLARAAKERGIRLLAVTDHSPSIQESARESYFRALRFCEPVRYGVRLLYGTEADVTDTNGTLGMSDEVLALMDLVIASLHPPCFHPSDRETNTLALVNAVKSGRVDIVGHPDDEKYPLDLPTLVDVCKEYGTMVELNNSSLAPDGYRGNAKPLDTQLLKLCKEKKVYVSLGSDSHGRTGVGDFRYCLELIRECSFPEELIVNTSPSLFSSLLKPHHEARKQLVR